MEPTADNVVALLVALPPGERTRLVCALVQADRGPVGEPLAMLMTQLAHALLSDPASRTHELAQVTGRALVFADKRNQQIRAGADAAMLTQHMASLKLLGFDWKAIGKEFGLRAGTARQRCWRAGYRFGAD